MDPCKNETSNFRGMEHLKLLKQRMERQILLKRLKREDLIVDHFPLHNEWELDRQIIGGIPMEQQSENSMCDAEQSNTSKSI